MELIIILPMAKITKNLLIAGSFLFLIFLISWPYILKIAEIKKEEPQKQEEAEVPKVKREKPEVDVSGWKTYRSNWYGFEVQYPENWGNPVIKNSTKQDKWEYKYLFRKKEENNSYLGFDVVVYDTRKVKRVLDSDEFPSLKNEELKTEESCNTINGNLFREESYLPEEIYISSENNCFVPALFYAFASGNYAYNVVPIGQKTEEAADIKDDIINNFPEFFSVTSNFNIIEIQRPKPVPKITAPKPIAKTKAGPGGLRVCAKKGDDPSRSDTHSKKHMDMECCLDPDEIPNPHCYYSTKKYGKYLD